MTPFGWSLLVVIVFLVFGLGYLVIGCWEAVTTITENRKENDW